MSHRIGSDSPDDQRDAERLQNALLNATYNAEFSRRDAIKAAFALAGAAVLFGLPSPAHAASATKETLDALANAEKQLDDVEKQLDAIGKQFQDLSIQQDKTISQIENVQGQIDDTQDQIDEQQEELENKQELLASRVSTSYKNGPTGTLSLLLSSSSFEELISNAHYIDKVNASDKQTIEDIHTIQEMLTQQKLELEKQKKELEELKAKQDDQLKQMRSKQAEIKDIVDGLSQDVKDLMAKRDAEYLASVQEEEAQRKAAEEAKRRAEEEAKRKQQGGGTTYIPGQGEQAGKGSQQRVVAAAKSTPSPGVGLCAAWVTYVFINAGLGSISGNACDMYSSWCTSSNKSNLKVGMIISVSSHPHTSAGIVYGHVGIYVGNNTVMDNIGYIRSINVDEWISYYGGIVTPRWGWLGGIALA